jgi:flagellar biosynthesis GTPase FlhF
VGDLCCGTATLSCDAIEMGVNAIAVDIDNEAVVTSGLRLQELKANIEAGPYTPNFRAHNPISALSTIPNWSTRDLNAVGDQVKEYDVAKKQQKADRAKKKADFKKKTKEKKVASDELALAQKKKQESDAKLAIAKAADRAADDDETDDEEMTSNKEEEDEEKEEEEDEEEQEDEKKEEEEDEKKDEETETTATPGDDETEHSEIDVGTIQTPAAVSPVATRSKDKPTDKQLL